MSENAPNDDAAAPVTTVKYGKHHKKNVRQKKNRLKNQNQKAFEKIEEPVCETDAAVEGAQPIDEEERNEDERQSEFADWSKADALATDADCITPARSQVEFGRQKKKKGKQSQTPSHSFFSESQKLFRVLCMNNLGLTCTIDSSLEVIHACFRRSTLERSAPLSPICKKLQALFSSPSHFAHQAVLGELERLIGRSFNQMASQTDATRQLLEAIMTSVDDSSWKPFGFNRMDTPGNEEDSDGLTCLDLGSRNSSSIDDLVLTFMRKYGMKPAQPRQFFIVLCAQPFDERQFREYLEVESTIDNENFRWKYQLVGVTSSSSFHTGHAIACVRNYDSSSTPFTYVDGLSGREHSMSFASMARQLSNRVVSTWAYELCRQ